MVVLAGCVGGTGGDGGNDATNGDGVGDGDGAGDERATVAVAVGLSAEAQQEIAGTVNRSEQGLLRRAQLAPGNLTVEERQSVRRIQQETEEARQEALEEARAEFESRANSTRTLSVEGSQPIPQQGSTLFLVSGSPSEILGLLNESGVRAITGEGQYDQIEQQQQPRQPGRGAPAP